LSWHAEYASVTALRTAKNSRKSERKAEQDLNCEILYLFLVVCSLRGIHRRCSAKRALIRSNSFSIRNAVTLASGLARMSI